MKSECLDFRVNPVGQGHDDRDFLVRRRTHGVLVSQRVHRIDVLDGQIRQGFPVFAPRLWFYFDHEVPVEDLPNHFHPRPEILTIYFDLAVFGKPKLNQCFEAWGELSVCKYFRKCLEVGRSTKSNGQLPCASEHNNDIS